MAVVACDTQHVCVLRCPCLPSRSGSSLTAAGSCPQQQQHEEGLDTAQGHDDDDVLPANDPDGSDAEGSAVMSDGGDADSEGPRDVDGLGSNDNGTRTAGQGSGGSSSSSPSHTRRGRQRQQLHVAKLSNLEAGRLEQAKQRHRQQIAQPKVRCCLAGRCSLSVCPCPRLLH